MIALIGSGLFLFFAGWCGVIAARAAEQSRRVRARRAFAAWLNSRAAIRPELWAELNR